MRIRCALGDLLSNLAAAHNMPKRRHPRIQYFVWKKVRKRDCEGWTFRLLMLLQLNDGLIVHVGKHFGNLWLQRPERLKVFRSSANE